MMWSGGGGWCGATHGKWSRGAAWCAVRPCDGSGQSGPRGHVAVLFTAMMVESGAIKVTESLHDSVRGPCVRAQPSGDGGGIVWCT